MQKSDIPTIEVEKVEILSNAWRPLKQFTIHYSRKGRKPEKQVREIYDRGDGASVLLYDLENKTVVLTRQFRLPAYINGHPDGMLTEVCAGLLDGDSAETGIRREALEETGYALEDIEHVASVYMTPGADTEMLHLYLSPYNENMKVHEGGGLDEESEDIDVLEMTFDEVFRILDDGQIMDAKTLILLQALKLKL